MKDTFVIILLFIYVIGVLTNMLHYIFYLLEINETEKVIKNLKDIYLCVIMTLFVSMFSWVFFVKIQELYLDQERYNKRLKYEEDR